jgi:hypothetical protein
MVELKSLTLAKGKAYEKKIFQNFDEHENKSELVTGTNLLQQSSASYKCRYSAAATSSHTYHHYMAEACRENTAVPHIRNYRHVR